VPVPVFVPVFPVADSHGLSANSALQVTVDGHSHLTIVPKWDFIVDQVFYGNPEREAAFKNAVDVAILYLESKFSDRATLHITFGLHSIADDAHAETDRSTVYATGDEYPHDYKSLKHALKTVYTSSDQMTAYKALPSNLPKDDQFYVTNALEKVLFPFASQPASDGTVWLNSTLLDTFTFDPNLRATPYKVDGIVP
jgi:hypothetical protein